MMHRRVVLLISLAVIAPLGFYAKRGYSGPAAHWVHDGLGGVFYEIFWCLAVAPAVPRARPVTIAAWVFAATCALEFLQLWHPAPLEWMRGFFLGRTILGSFFDWWDFLHYLIGSILGWFWLRAIAARAT
jgi:hypothetical protein